MFDDMKAATVHEIKQELIHLSPAKLTEICLRLAKFKKDNKELLTFLLFESGDENGYIQSVKNEMDEMFTEINHSNIYYTKKTLRKILRITNKHIRYVAIKTAEVELLIHFCRKVKETKIPLTKSVLLANIYNGQLKKIEKLISLLHEDLQYDYFQQTEALK
jgi:hypothetical protein